MKYPMLKEFRSKIKRLENEIIHLGGTTDANDGFCPLRHFFIDGVYMREMTAFKNTVLVGVIHKLEHISIILKGTLYIYDISGVRKVSAPYVWISQPGAQRAAYVEEDVVWLTVHGVDKGDHEPEEMLEVIGCRSVEEFEKLMEDKAKQLTLEEA